MAMASARSASAARCPPTSSAKSSTSRALASEHVLRRCLSGEGVAGDKPVVNQALDSIMGMAVQMPALKALGEELGVSMEDVVAGLVEGAVKAPKASPQPKQEVLPEEHAAE